MTIDPRRRAEATAIFKLGMKADQAGVHRTLNRPPKGKGWIQGHNMPPGLMIRPEKVREAIVHYERAYAIFPDIVALNQIAIAYEMLGEVEAARERFTAMSEQGEREGFAAYVKAAEMALERLK
ncbi:MAG: hypothetical protein ACREOU_02220 [Candidatus Eiseniibacteriota bacterium]